MPRGAGDAAIERDPDGPLATARAGSCWVTARGAGGIAMAPVSNLIVRKRAGVDRAVCARAVQVSPYALLALGERVAREVGIRAVLALEPVGAAQEPGRGLTRRTRAWRPRYAARACAGATARRPRLRAARRARARATRGASPHATRGARPHATRRSTRRSSGSSARRAARRRRNAAAGPTRAAALGAASGTVATLPARSRRIARDAAAPKCESGH